MRLRLHYFSATEHIYHTWARRRRTRPSQQPNQFSALHAAQARNTVVVTQRTEKLVFSAHTRCIYIRAIYIIYMYLSLCRADAAAAQHHDDPAQQPSAWFNILASGPALHCIRIISLVVYGIFCVLCVRSGRMREEEESWWIKMCV